MSNIHAIYENGVFRPSRTSEFAGSDAKWKFEIRGWFKPELQAPSLDEVYAILAEALCFRRT